MMRKYTVSKHNGQIKVIEIECEILSKADYPAAIWLPAGEYYAKIISPQLFHKKVEREINGKKAVVLEPDVWHSHAVLKAKKILEEDSSQFVQTIEIETIRLD